MKKHVRMLIGAAGLSVAARLLFTRHRPHQQRAESPFVCGDACGHNRPLFNRHRRAQGHVALPRSR